MIRPAIWFQQARGPFLILAVVLVFLGTSAAHSVCSIHWLQVVLLTIGVVLAHAAVNLYNEFSDNTSGIDLNTSPTPFSGGSGMMRQGITRPADVRIAACVSLFIASAIGIYFCIVSSWWIAAFMIAGGAAILFYTSHFAKWMIGEPVAGLTLGSLVVLGVYLSLTGTISHDVVFMSVPPGILTLQLLFLNEFPDAEADKAGGRHHWVIHFGHQKCAVIYTLLHVFLYLYIIALPLMTRYSKMIFIALATLPLAFIASAGVLRHHSSHEKLIPFMAMNVIIVLLTDILLGLGLLLA